MVSLKLRRHHGRHTERSLREMPATWPPPEWATPLLSWLERKARGEWCNPAHEDWMRALQKRLDAWERDSVSGSR